MRHECVRTVAGDALTFPEPSGAVGLAMPSIRWSHAFRIVDWPQARESRGESWR